MCDNDNRGSHNTKRRKLNTYADRAPHEPELQQGFPPTTSITNASSHHSLSALGSHQIPAACNNKEPDHKWICIGTLQLEAKLKRTDCPADGVFPVSYQHGGRLMPTVDEKENCGSLPKVGDLQDARLARVLSELLSADNVVLEFFCRRIKGTKGCLLVNVCTVSELVTDFGAFLDKLGLFLQDPVTYTADLPYQNPHLLSHLGSGSVMLSTLDKGVDVEQFSAPTDIFDDLLVTNELPESATPSLISTPLLSHQRQALYFMQQRERSQAPGGLLADQMGLGKTLQMISLIASDHDAGQFRANACGQVTASGATLVIVPLSLLSTWKDQFEEHVVQQRLTIYVHYGPNRARATDFVERSDVMLTTYDIVAAEFRKLNTEFVSIIFGRSWRRVILDEAHLIKNPTALRTNAVIQIQSHSRWAVTGTPIQNRLSDLSALFRFLRYVPYDDPANFRREILEPWRMRSDVGAVTKLKELLRCIAIRRSKALLDLPHREDRIHHIDFSPEEAVIYEEERTALQRQILEAEPSDSSSYPNVLRWIDRLRGFCSRGEQSEIPSEAMSMIHQAGDREVVQSDMVDKPLLDGFWDDDRTDYIDQELAYHSPSHTVGFEAVPNGFRVEALQGLSPFTPTSRTEGTPEGSPGETQTPFLSPHADNDGPDVPTKIRALVSDITNHAGKCVVFSFWRSTLTAAGNALTGAGVRCVRIDGQLNKMAREQTLTQFRQDQDIKVILATISVAAVGLDLTVANLACLLEPQWNPSVEEQALSRVHRMRQKLPVTTIRYVVRDSIEENVLELQKRKLRLAHLALSGDASPPSISALEDLRCLLS